MSSNYEVIFFVVCLTIVSYDCLFISELSSDINFRMTAAIFGLVIFNA